MTNSQESEPHDHGPRPSNERVIEGDSQTATQHLRTLAPYLSLDGHHFDITEAGRVDADLPALFLISLQGAAVGAVDFLPLPAARALMRLFLCSDLASNTTGGQFVVDGGRSTRAGTMSGAVRR